ncbi:MAG: ATP-binding protein [Myxococcota bacterium]
MSEFRGRTNSLVPTGESEDDFSLSRLRWIIRLRWYAMLGVVFAAGAAMIGLVPGLAWPVMLLTAACGSFYNFLLWRSHQSPAAPTGWRAAMTQALMDLVMLTIVLWAAGGVSSPFVGYYVFHVALAGILGGPRATAIAAGMSLFFAGLLALVEWVPPVQIGIWNPTPPWDALTTGGAFATTVIAVAYLVTHTMRELRDRERELSRAGDRAALEYQLLSNTLDELDAGLEVVDEHGVVMWRNKRAEELAPSSAAVGSEWTCPGKVRPCENDAAGICPVLGARSDGTSGRCRFAVSERNQERVYEMMVFPLATQLGKDPRTMNLYVDRTQATLAERNLMIAERLASLGRIAQGVAHELNTPLATIRTLATDMREALKAFRDPRGAGDLDESAALIQDETRRLARITHALLAGGDLARGRIEGSVSLVAVVERARALVFAGLRKGPEILVSPTLSDVEVLADSDRLVQVLVNLLQNATDAVRDQGQSRIQIDLDHRDDRVDLLVEDDGPGIAPSMDARLFEPFATTKPPGEGTGLGLYTSYMLVEAMGGRLSLEPVEPHGTRARVSLTRAARGCPFPETHHA